jgi:transmembrane sensor
MDLDRLKMEDEIIGRIFSDQHNCHHELIDDDGLPVDVHLLQQTQQVVDRIEQLKQMQAIDSEKALNLVKHRFREKKSKKWMLVFQKAAAVFLLPLLAFALWQTYRNDNRTSLSTMIEISSPATLRSVFTLPDGTKVWLNGGSSLKYPTHFTGPERLVELIGEAYFAVSHNKEVPFLVKNEQLLVKALGTEFNFCAYPNEPRVEAVLTKGKVAIITEQNGIRKELTTLQPNQMIVYEKKINRMYKENVAVEKYTSWREGTIIFKNDHLSDVLVRLGRWYNVEFLIDKNLKSDYSFTGSFRGEELSQILNYIELTTPVQFEILKSEQNADQVYLKTKIRIKAKK